MSIALNQLEKRLNELEAMRRQRQTWLNELVAPMTERLQYLAQLRSDQIASGHNNVIRFPIERRLAEEVNV